MPTPFTTNDLAMWSPMSMYENTTYFPYLPFEHPLMPPCCPADHPLVHYEPDKTINEEHEHELGSTRAEEHVPSAWSLPSPKYFPVSTECPNVPFARAPAELTPCPFLSDTSYPRVHFNGKRNTATSAPTFMQKTWHWWKALIHAKHRYIHPTVHLQKRASARK
ncbi:hypothetical protein BC940DRAFT_314152 [Gongronella butleri]|nr:hypothetical protein BC940DRAFT_314152 [Gongronella butleri]